MTPKNNPYPMSKWSTSILTPDDMLGEWMTMSYSTQQAFGSRPEPPVRIPAKRANRVVLLDPAEILWFEAEETIVFARTDAARLLVERTLSDLEVQLGRAFFRAHRRYLVNISAIVEILPGEGGAHRIVMRDPERSSIPLSRRQARRSPGPARAPRVPWILEILRLLRFARFV